MAEIWGSSKLFVSSQARLDMREERRGTVGETDKLVIQLIAPGNKRGAAGAEWVVKVICCSFVLGMWWRTYVKGVWNKLKSYRLVKDRIHAGHRQDHARICKTEKARLVEKQKRRLR